MKTYHLFISHSWNYSEQYKNLINMLDQAPRFQYRDFSVPRNAPVHSAGSDAQLAEAIRNQMASCGVVIVMAGMYATCSKWMEKEMRFAKSSWQHQKPVLAVIPWGNERVSREVTERADKIVRWNTDSIVSAIRELG